MKREIKFRGRCIKSGDWVYGDLIHGVGYKNGNLYILPNKTNLANVKNCDPLDGVQVIPESVGQYTGLTDKKGKEIYEGDLDQDSGRVFYNESMARFQIDYGGDIDIADMENVGEWMIVSGNIYENPELLNHKN